MSDNYNVYVNDDTEPNVSVSADSDVSALVDDDSNVVLDVEEDAGALLNADINDEELVDVPIEETIGELGADHRRLLHRDAADQHPMSAITGLTDSLTGLQNTIDSGLISVETSVSDVTLLANGKNTVYHSSTMPTGGEYKVGDTWFNSSESYCMYKWDGSNWIREQFGNGAFANASIWNATIQDGAITNAKIADATIEGAKIKDAAITNAKISSLDGGKITANSLTIGKMASDVTNAITTAGATASNYITTIDGRSGICVHNAGDVSNYVNINASGMGSYVNGSLVASFGSGGGDIYAGQYRLNLNANGLVLYNGNNTVNLFLDPSSVTPYARLIRGSDTHGGMLTMNINTNSSMAGIRAAYGGNVSRVYCHNDNGTAYVLLNGNYVETDCPIYIGNYKLLTTGTVTATGSIAADSTGGGTATASLAGYTPIGILGFEPSGSNYGHLNIYNVSLSGSTVTWRGYNFGSSTASVTMTITILYIASTQGV